MRMPTTKGLRVETITTAFDRLAMVRAPVQPNAVSAPVWNVLAP